MEKVKVYLGGGISGGVHGGMSNGINEGTSEEINGGVNEGINRIREFVRNQPCKMVSEISAALDIPSKTVEGWVKKLRKQGVIVFRSPRKTGGYHVN